MNSMKFRQLALFLALAIGVASCADVTAPRPQAPAAASNGLIGGLLGGVINTVSNLLDILGQPVDKSVHVLRRSTALAEDVSYTQVVGVARGKIVVPKTGLTIEIPYGALKSATPITVTALAGDKVAYEFGPHGLLFQKPVRVTQSLTGTYAENKTVSYEAIYFGPSNDGGLLGGVLGLVLEILNIDVNRTTNSVGFDVRHFSGYLVSTGRMSSDDGNGGY